jgi:hypothetical protein
MGAFPVGLTVNKVTNDTPDLLTPLETATVT